MNVLFKFMTWSFKAIILAFILVGSIGVSLLYATMEFVETMYSCFEFGVEFLSNDKPKEKKDITTKP